MTEFAVLARSSDLFNRRQAAYRVEVLPSLYARYEERVENAAPAGTLPCLLAVDQPFIASFAWRGYLQPIDRYVPRQLLADLLPSMVTAGTYDGRLYTLGQFDSGLGLWGNRRYLDGAGVRPATLRDPWTLAEFEQALAKLSAAGQADYALDLGLHVPASEFYAYAFSPILQGFGGDLIDRRTGRASGVLDGRSSVQAMERLQHWLARGWTQPVLDRTDDFERGRAALAWTGHWKYGSFHRALGRDLVLMPLPDFGRGIKTGISSWSWAMSTTCTEPDGAWRFLAFLLTPDEILRMTDANGAVPARYSALARSRLYGPAGPLRMFGEQLEAGYGVPRPSTPGYATIRSAFYQAVRDIVADRNVQEALSRAARAIDADVARHRGYPSHR